MTTYLVDITIPILQTRKQDLERLNKLTKISFKSRPICRKYPYGISSKQHSTFIYNYRCYNTPKNNLLSYYKSNRIKMTKPKGVARDDAAFPLHYLRNMTNS